tara:strand:- start:687 stop:950 length:264 start_codon:yes stop_codon:yes gene_type:complete
MSEVRDKIKEIITDTISYSEDGRMGAFFLDQALDKLFENFHISEKLTEEELDKYRHYKHKIRQGDRLAKYFIKLIDKLIGASDENNT